MLLKKGNIVMLPSEEPCKSVVIGEENVMSFGIGSIVFNNNAQPPLRLVTKDKAYSNTMGYVKVHLYVFVKGSIKEKDLILNEEYCAEDMIIAYCKETFPIKEEYNKLIASTDNSLNVAKFPIEFIDKFVEDNSITDILIIYEENKQGDIVPIIKKGNVISLSNKQENYSSEEVVKLFNEFFEVHGIAPADEELIWIDKNI